MSASARNGLKRVAKLFARLLIILIVSFVLLLWRLSSSPIQLNQFVPKIEQITSNLPGGLSVKLQGIELFWNRDQRELDLRAVGIELLEASGATIVSTPEVDVSLSVYALIRGVIALSSIELKDVDVRVVRTEDGSFQIFGKGASKPQEPPPASTEEPHRDFMENALHIVDVLELDADPDYPLSYLDRIRISGSVEVQDQKSGVSWSAENVEALFESQNTVINGELKATIATPQPLQGIGADVKLTLKQNSLSASLVVNGLDPASIAQFNRRMSALNGLEVVFDTTINTSITLPDEIHSLTASIKGHAGRFAHPELYPTALTVNSLDLQLSADLPGRVMAQLPLTRSLSYDNSM